MNCPKCGSVKISSNQLSVPAERVAQGAHVLHRAGMPLAALTTLVGAFGIQAVNGLRHSWSCNDCHHRFS